MWAIDKAPKTVAYYSSLGSWSTDLRAVIWNGFTSETYIWEKWNSLFSYENKLFTSPLSLNIVTISVKLWLVSESGSFAVSAFIMAVDTKVWLIIYFRLRTFHPLCSSLALFHRDHIPSTSITLFSSPSDISPFHYFHQSPFVI